MKCPRCGEDSRIRKNEVNAGDFENCKADVNVELHVDKIADGVAECSVRLVAAGNIDK